jgi:hypothetical protein
MNSSLNITSADVGSIYEVTSVVIGVERPGVTIILKSKMPGMPSIGCTTDVIHEWRLELPYNFSGSFDIQARRLIRTHLEDILEGLLHVCVC